MDGPASATPSSARRGRRGLPGAVRASVPNSSTTASQKRSSRMVVGSSPRLISAVPMGAAMLKHRVAIQAEDQPRNADEGRDIRSKDDGWLGSWKSEVGSRKSEVG